jgi:hypothetical protein
MVRDVSTMTSLALSFLFIGCANLGKALSQSGEYDFRKTRWGFFQERVMLSEQGKRIHLKKRKRGCIQSFDWRYWWNALDYRRHACLFECLSLRGNYTR